MRKNAVSIVRTAIEYAEGDDDKLQKCELTYSSDIAWFSAFGLALSSPNDDVEFHRLVKCAYDCEAKTKAALIAEQAFLKSWNDYARYHGFTFADVIAIFTELRGGII